MTDRFAGTPQSHPRQVVERLRDWLAANGLTHVTAFESDGAQITAIVREYADGRSRLEQTFGVLLVQVLTVPVTVPPEPELLAQLDPAISQGVRVTGPIYAATFVRARTHLADVDVDLGFRLTARVTVNIATAQSPTRRRLRPGDPVAIELLDEPWTAVPVVRLYAGDGQPAPSYRYTGVSVGPPESLSIGAQLWLGWGVSWSTRVWVGGIAAPAPSDPGGSQVAAYLSGLLPHRTPIDVLCTHLDDHGGPIGRLARADGGQDVAQLLLDAELVVPIDESLAAAAEAGRGVDALTRDDH